MRFTFLFISMTFMAFDVLVSNSFWVKVSGQICWRYIRLVNFNHSSVTVHHSPKTILLWNQCWKSNWVCNPPPPLLQNNGTTIIKIHWMCTILRVNWRCVSGIIVRIIEYTCTLQCACHSIYLWVFSSSRLQCSTHGFIVYEFAHLICLFFKFEITKYSRLEDSTWCTQTYNIALVLNSEH